MSFAETILRISTQCLMTKCRLKSWFTKRMWISGVEMESEIKLSGSASRPKSPSNFTVQLFQQHLSNKCRGEVIRIDITVHWTLDAAAVL